MAVQKLNEKGVEAALFAWFRSKSDIWIEPTYKRDMRKAIRAYLTVEKTED